MVEASPGQQQAGGVPKPEQTGEGSRITSSAASWPRVNAETKRTCNGKLEVCRVRNPTAAGGQTWIGVPREPGVPQEGPGGFLELLVWN